MIRGPVGVDSWGAGDGSAEVDTVFLPQPAARNAKADNVNRDARGELTVSSVAILWEVCARPPLYRATPVDVGSSTECGSVQCLRAAFTVRRLDIARRERRSVRE